MRCNDQFSKLKGIGDLIKKLVESKKDVLYSLVFLLVKLAMVLPITIVSIERIFSTMKMVKNRLYNRMEDSWMNDFFFFYHICVEKDY